MSHANPPIRVLEAPLEDDLAELSRYLWDAGVPHRFHEEGGKQVLLVSREDHAEQARAAYEAYRAGRLEVRPRTGRWRLVDTRQLVLLWQRMPVSCSLVILCIVFFPVTWGDPETPGKLLRLLSFSDFQIVGEYLRYPDFVSNLRTGQFWRLWTPALLHFGALHLIFNLLVLWLLAPRIEVALGGWRLVAVVLIVTPVSNCAQDLISNWPLFGGMSGVDYGLLGYLLIAGRYLPYPVLRLPLVIVAVMLLSLVLLSLGIMRLFGIEVANGAHWSGLGAGLLLGAVFTWRDRRKLALRDALRGDGA